MSYFLLSRVTQGKETLWFYNLSASLRVSLPIQPLQLWGYIAQQGAYRENNCDVTLPRWQNFWISTVCLDRADGRKKRMGYCFVPECNPAQESHTCQVFSFFFFCHTCRATFAAEIQKFCYPQTTPPPHHHHTHPTCSCLYTPFTQDLISKCIFSKMSPLHLLLYKRWEICLF